MAPCETNWTVSIEVETPGDLSEEEIFAVAEIGGVASGEPGGRRIGTTLTRAAPDAVAALASAILAVAGAVGGGGRVLSAEVMTIDEAERHLAEPAFPPLVGVSEVADLLGITRQRASVLQTRPDFPSPVALLASGPVWRRNDITTFEAAWTRRSGRPRRVG